MGNLFFPFVFPQNCIQNQCAKLIKMARQASPHPPLVPGSNTILTSIPTHHPVLPSFNELFSTSNNSLPSTSTTPDSSIILVDLTHYLVLPPLEYDNKLHNVNLEYFEYLSLKFIN